MADAGVLGPRARDRLAPLVADAIAAGGGLVLAIGVLLIGIDAYADHNSRWPGAAMFAGLVVVAFFALGFLPRSLRPGGVAAVAGAVPGVLGFIFFPNAHSFGHLRPSSR